MPQAYQNEYGYYFNAEEKILVHLNKNYNRFDCKKEVLRIQKHDIKKDDYNGLKKALKEIGEMFRELKSIEIDFRKKFKKRNHVVKNLSKRDSSELRFLTL